MRSRYAAFALGLGEYLADTLAEAHEDRAAPRDLLVRTLARVRERQRFLGLTILEARTTTNEGEVLFFARVFERGTSRSFAELSRFVMEGGAWRYESGVLVAMDALPRDGTLTRERLLAMAELGDAPAPPVR